MHKANVVFACTENSQMKAIALLVQKASAFESSIYILKDDRRANAKSLLGLISLGIDDKDTLCVQAEGSDSEQAVASLISFLLAADVS
ncbi:MAG TPA: HPr family phosphocarrier protein [Clostridiaceae bacterium]|nr:HPr family phosphocarrier protein [Clostridiaceae bacterium]